VQGEFEGRGDFTSEEVVEAQDNNEAACDFASEVAWKLATTRPTTLAGVAAVLRFANEFEDAGNEWPNTDPIGPEGWHYQLRATMAAALEAIIPQMGYEPCPTTSSRSPSRPAFPQAEDHSGHQRTRGAIA
jgi:hypothetical protein